MDIMNTILFLTIYSVFLAALSHAVNETVEGNNEIFRNKHPSLHNCPSFELGPDEYILYPNGTIYVESYNKTYNESFYFLKDNTVTICVPDNPYPNTDYENENEKELENEYEYANNLKYLSQIGLSISMVCLVLHLLVFVLVPALRNLPGYNLASLCFSLFICYLFSIFTDSENLSKNRNMCIATAVLIQYFFMASFLWMSVIAFDVYRALLQATGNLRVSNMQFTLKKYGFYCIFSWGISLVFTSAALIADNANGIDELYKPQFERNCWFRYKESLLVFFAGPIFVMIISNLIIFFLSVYTIFSNRMKSDESSNKMLLKKQALLYFRLAVIMGIAWFAKLLAIMINVVWLWYVSAALNVFQGLFIFLAFTCTKKVKNHLMSRLFGKRKNSEPALNPTFQSYCYYANSIEKDLDKIVDSDKQKPSIDTIVIHI